MAAWVRKQKCRLDSYPHVGDLQGKEGDHTGSVQRETRRMKPQEARTVKVWTEKEEHFKKGESK